MPTRGRITRPAASRWSSQSCPCPRPRGASDPGHRARGRGGRAHRWSRGCSAPDHRAAGSDGGLQGGGRGAALQRVGLRRHGYGPVAQVQRGGRRGPAQPRPDDREQRPGRVQGHAAGRLDRIRRLTVCVARGGTGPALAFGRLRGPVARRDPRGRPVGVRDRPRRGHLVAGELSRGGQVLGRRQRAVRARPGPRSRPATVQPGPRPRALTGPAGGPQDEPRWDGGDLGALAAERRTGGSGGCGVAHGTGALAPRGRHCLREGGILGLVVATSIWLWIAIVDALAGEPFRTFAVLGGIRLFTVLHYALCLAYGVA